MYNEIALLFFQHIYLSAYNFKKSYIPYRGCRPIRKKRSLYVNRCMSASCCDATMRANNVFESKIQYFLQIKEYSELNPKFQLLIIEHKLQLCIKSKY